ncbi:hypothetical protein K1719_000197 [Acacia pycnantha]|nr:hypothetical protein K1719_000197 [Acacia pycnantha]
MSQSAREDLEYHLAIVPYSERPLVEVINGFMGLGLKRGADDDLEAPITKRRKLDMADPKCYINEISIYAGNLRKTKTRLRRQGRRRDKGNKENIPMDTLDCEEMLDVPVSLDAEEHGFVFRAKSGRRKKTEAEVVFHIDPVGSDHHALVIDCCYSEAKAPRTFKFEATWVQLVDFLKVVGNSWNEITVSNVDSLLDLIQRLDLCRRKLMEWSKREFPNFRRVIDHLRRELCLCYEGSFTDEKLREAENLVSQIEEAWKNEEIYWWQRRMRNKILRLKTTNGVWLEDRAAINKEFSEFYRSIFSSVGGRPMEQTISYVQRVVTDDDNACLMKPVIDIEIEEAMFQLGANKAPGSDGFSALFFQSSWKEVNKEQLTMALDAGGIHEIGKIETIVCFILS